MSGRVVLPDGKPAAFASLVNQSFGQGEGRSFSDRIETDDAGQFTIAKRPGTTFRVHVYSKDQKFAYLGLVPNENGVQIKLQPACETEIKITCSVGTPKGQLNVLWSYDHSLPWLTELDEKGIAKAVLPQGEYILTLFSDDFDLFNHKIKVDKPKESLTVESKPNPFGAWRSQPAPELTLANKEGKRYKLDDFKGKYLVLEFWGWWCAPCVESSLPAFKRLVKAHPEWAGKVEVLAVHENVGGGRNWPQILEAVKKFETQFWDGPLPFEMVLEDKASLSKLFGIKAYPTAVLINPEGKVVNRVDADNLAGFLRL